MSTAAGATKQSDEQTSALRKHAIEQIVALIKQEFIDRGESPPSRLAMEMMAKKRLESKYLT